MEEAAELVFDLDFSDRDSDFTDSGSDDEPELETEEVIESENEPEQVIEIAFVNEANIRDNEGGQRFKWRPNNRYPTSRKVCSSTSYWH